VTAPQRPTLRDDLTVVELDGEAVVYDDRTGDLLLRRFRRAGLLRPARETPTEELAS
jgi:hypothetical protein